MEVIQYNGKNVYTNSLNRVTEKELNKAKVEIGTIAAVYFFQLSPDRFTERVDFDEQKIKRQQSGLNVDVNLPRWGTASVSIAGLDGIVKFLCDSACLGKDLSVLTGRKVNTYNSGMQLLGIEVV